MAVFAALGKALGDHVVETIFSFVEDSSVVANLGSDATDIANLTDLTNFDNVSDLGNRYWNKCLSHELLCLEVSRIYWQLN